MRVKVSIFLAKTGKKSLLSGRLLGLLILLFFIMVGCVEFRMSDQEAMEKHREASDTEILFGDFRLEDRIIHYAYTDNKRRYLLVFVHGSPGSWSSFLDFFQADSILKTADMLAIDRPGFGYSDFGKAEPSLKKQAELLHAVTEQFIHQHKILIGHSMGGPIIGRMAMEYAEDYSGLIFVAASIDPQLEKLEWYRPIIDTKIGGFFTPKEFEVSNDELMPLKGELEEMMPLWGSIRIPSVVIQGTKDRLVPKENADFAENMLIDSLTRVVRLEGVDHFIPWSNPKTIIEAIQLLINNTPSHHL